jgi:glycosyltransferase involved in cell wall biosynthesis
MNLLGGFKPDSWFRVPPSVKVLWKPSLHNRWIPDADVVFATAWQTAEWVTQYPARCGRQYYLIQGLETCFEGVDEAQVMATWRAPFSRIVISRWLLNIAREMGLEAHYIPNGLNHDEFFIEIPQDHRDSRQVLMIYHHQACKDFSTGLQAVLKARESIPDLQVTAFGMFKRPLSLPGWIEYHRNPPRSKIRELYNKAAIFVSSSRVEGWGLPPCEAAQCGAALCVTDIGGHQEFAIHEETALLSPPGSALNLADNLVRLVNDDELRLRLARNGHEFVQRFTWPQSASALEKILCSS